VTAVAAAAGCTPDELVHIPHALLAELYNELRLPLVDKIAVERFIGLSRSARPDIAAVQEKAEDRRIHPWKIDEERALRLHSRFVAEHGSATKAGKSPFDSLRATFMANAKAGLLSAEHALILSYILYAESVEFGGFLLANLLLHVPSDMRLSTHNWCLAQSMENSVKHALGPRIAVLSRPLFPPQAPGSDTLNAKLLTTGDQIHGGEQPGAGLFSPEPLLPVVGAGFVPVGQLPDGSWAADTSSLESELRRQIAGMERKLTMLGHPPRSRQVQKGVAGVAQTPEPQPQPQHRPRGHQGAQSALQRRFPIRGGDSASPAAAGATAATFPGGPHPAAPAATVPPPGGFR
jgi:hypothetical protein